jgi:3-mercaptopyruvate sulfurtransferase SseA
MIMSVDTASRTHSLANDRISGQTVRRKLRESGHRARHQVVGPISKQRHRTARIAWAHAHRRCKNIVLVSYGTQWQLINFELSATIMTNSSTAQIITLPAPKRGGALKCI